MIQYPTREPEAEVQAALFASLRALGYDAHLEVPAPVGKGHRRWRFDIVVFGQDSAAMVIIETKRARRDPKRSKTEITDKERARERTQIKKYRQFGLPVITCYGNRGIPAALLQLQLDFPNHQSEAGSWQRKSADRQIRPLRGSSRPSSERVSSRKGFRTF